MGNCTDQFSTFFNNNENKTFKLCLGFRKLYCLKKDLKWFNNFTITIKKDSFSDCECLHYFVAVKALYVIARDFSINGFQEDELQDILVGYWQLIKYITHIGDALLDHVYVLNIFLEEFGVYVFNIWFVFFWPICSHGETIKKRNSFSHYLHTI